LHWSWRLAFYVAKKPEGASFLPLLSPTPHLSPCPLTKPGALLMLEAPLIPAGTAMTPRAHYLRPATED
jgi:hypothetical protein